MEWLMPSTLVTVPVRFSPRGASTPTRGRSAIRLAPLGVSLALIPLAAFAVPDPSPADAPKDSGQGPMQEVVIFARGENLIGKAAASSEGAVGGADLSVRPLLRVAELLEVVPGLIAAQHSGSGKANQYFLRGFNLDHGTDFTTYIDDVPMNLRTHGHGQGYLDLNGLIPEVVERVDYRKGPYRADVGDFSLAGASFMTTIEKLDKPFLALEGGQYDWRRVAGGATTNLAGGDLTFIGQWKTYDGPWQLPENLQHQSFWSKYAHDTGLGALQLTFSGYHGKWHPTEQIPERAIGTPTCPDEFCALDTSAIGETWRYVASAGLKADKWRASLYAQYYDWHMLSDSTYSQQINQLDRRNIFGGRFERKVIEDARFTLNAGAEGRYDDVGRVGLQHTVEGVLESDVTKYSVQESSVSPYLEATWSPIDNLRLLGGARADFYDFDVKSKLDSSVKGSKSDNIFSPKLGAAYAVNGNLELYANWGRGFHSNDGRGVVIKLDDETPLVPGLVRGKGKELGARYQQGTFSVAATYWWLDLASELKFSGDANAAEPSNPSKRHGYEITTFWRPMPWLAIDAVWTGSHARSVPLVGDEPGHTYLEGAIESAGELGISAVEQHWEASVRLRYLGPYPLTDDNTHRASGESVINLRGAWKTDHYTVYAELLNVFDQNGKDIVYWYEAHAPGVDAVGAPDSCGASDNCRMSRAEEPRTLRFGVRYQF
jgi:outer membrane receptor protein involved in Fe transport